MKHTLTTLALVALTLGSAKATTVTGSGGTTGARFFTSSGTLLTSSNSTILVGKGVGASFAQFAVTDITPIAINDAIGTPAGGRWAGSFADTSATANPFNGAAIVFKITTTADGGGTSYFTSTSLFPTNGGGVGDSISVPASSLTTFSAADSGGGTAAFNASLTFGANSTPNGYVLIGTTPVPEPSVFALLGLVGLVGLRRKR